MIFIIVIGVLNQALCQYEDWGLRVRVAALFNTCADLAGRYHPLSRPCRPLTDPQMIPVIPVMLMIAYILFVDFAISDSLLVRANDLASMIYCYRAATTPFRSKRTANKIRETG